MSLPHFTDTKDIKETHTVGYLKTLLTVVPSPRPDAPGATLGFGHRLLPGQGASSTKRKTFPKPFNRHFCLFKHLCFCLWRPSQLDPSFLHGIYKLFRTPWSPSAGQGGGNERGPPVVYTLLDLVPCYFFLVEIIAVILLFHTERHFTKYNCDSFLTCYYRKIRKLFFTFYKVFSPTANRDNLKRQNFLFKL